MAYNNLTTTAFEEALAENLSLYCSESPVPNIELFSTHREISIARLALSNQAKMYFLACETLQTLLQNAITSASPDLVKQIMIAVTNIEERSMKLIESSQRTINLLGSVVNIDVDKARLSALIVSLPKLVKEAITQLGDESTADRISLSLNNRISEMMCALRHSDVPLPEEGTRSGPGISLQEYELLLNSVPSQP